jgi:hypothetical protein
MREAHSQPVRDRSGGDRNYKYSQQNLRKILGQTRLAVTQKTRHSIVEALLICPPLHRQCPAHKPAGTRHRVQSSPSPSLPSNGPLPLARGGRYC